MDVALGQADAGVAIAISVIDDYIRELARLGRLPQRIELERTFGGSPIDLTVLLDPPRFGLETPPGGPAFTRLDLTGTIEARPDGQPDADPLVFTLDATVRLSIVLLADDPDAIPDVGFRYDGVEGVPSDPVTPADLDEIFDSPAIAEVLDATRIPLAADLVEGLNASRFPLEASRPVATDWDVELTLMPAGADTEDSFAVTAAAPGASAVPAVVESFVAPSTGLAVAYNRSFLDLMLVRGAAAQVGTEVDDAEVRSLTLAMSDTAVAVKGHVVRPVFLLPDVDIRFEGPLVPSLIRGTTAMAFDPDGIEVKVDKEDRVFFAVLKWFVTVGASALLFTGWASLTMIGILLWLTAVQKVWNGDADIEDAPNTLRDSLAAALGAQLSLLAQALDDDTDVGAVRIDATPDSLVVVDGNIVLFAQILVVPIEDGMRSAEYSSQLRRFVIFELEDGRRFRAQELARLMRLGKVTVPGFHQVDGNYLRADPDDEAANNLLQSFRDNETDEVVVRSRRS